MSIAGVGGVTPAQGQTPIAKANKEAVEIPGVKDHDGDSDANKGVPASAAPAARTVNVKA